VSKNKLDFSADYAGPENNQNAPLGLPAPLPLQALYSTAALHSSENSTTPKVALSFQMDANNLFYAAAAKGFRPAGASQRVPITCDQDLVDLGYVDSSGNPSEPLEYTSDTVWSYELGSKNRLFDNRLVLDASAYYIKWKNIQTSLFLPNCAESFVNNIAEATSSGFDLGLQVNPLAGLVLSATVGYNKSQFGADGRSPGGVVIVHEDTFVPNSPAPWVYSVSGQYDFKLFEDRTFYVRTDLTRSSEARRVGNTDPNSTNYNADLAPIAAYTIVNARIGTVIGKADISLFINNLTGADPDLTALNRSALTGLKRYLWTDSTLRPRTVGLFASYRY